MWWQIFIHAVFIKTRNGHLTIQSLPSLRPPMSRQRLICLLHQQMRICHIIFPGCCTRMLITFYAFAPFSLLPRVLAKIIQDKATGLLIIPKWTTHSWFLLVLTLLIQHTQVIPPCRDLLYLPQQPQVVHPLHKKLSLLAVLLSGMLSRVSAYHNQLQPSSRNPGVLALGCNMTPFSEDGRQVHPLSPTILDVIAYLTIKYDCCLQYTTIAAAKSVLSGVLHIPELHPSLHIPL